VAIEGAVDGRNVRLTPDRLDPALGPARAAYAESGAAGRFTLRAEPADAAAWLIAAMK